MLAPAVPPNTEHSLVKNKKDRQTDRHPPPCWVAVHTPRHLQGNHLLSLTIEHLARTLDKQNLPLVKGKIKEMEFQKALEVSKSDKMHQIPAINYLAHSKLFPDTRAVQSKT